MENQLALVAYWTRESRANLLKMGVTEFQSWHDSLVRTHNMLIPKPATNG